MPHGLYLLAPIFVFNLAGQMMYILNQRLKAQNVSAEKASKVLTDIGGAIYKNDFVVQLMKNQKPLTIEFLKDLFNQLVHTSIMKLNETSMGKLFDLMVMSFKMQVFLSSSPCEIYQTTLNHIRELIRIIQKGPAIKNLEAAMAMFKAKYENLPAARYVEIKQEALRMLEGYRVRISVLLNQMLQNQDGTLFHKLRYTPYANKPIGTIEYLNKGMTTQDKVGPYDKELQLFKSKEFREWSTELGLNIFDGHIPGKSEKKESIMLGSSIKIPTSSQIHHASHIKPGSEEDSTLSTILLKNRKPIDQSETFTLDIFTEFGSKIQLKPGEIEQPKQAAVKQKPKVNNAFKDKILSDLEVEKPKQEQEEDDLLDMLDNATK